MKTAKVFREDYLKKKEKFFCKNYFCEKFSEKKFCGFLSEFKKF